MRSLSDSEDRTMVVPRELCIMVNSNWDILDQPAYPRRLIRIFSFRVRDLLIQRNLVETSENTNDTRSPKLTGVFPGKTWFLAVLNIPVIIVKMVSEKGYHEAI